MVLIIDHKKKQQQQKSAKHQTPKMDGENKQYTKLTAMRNDETAPTPKLPQKIQGKTGNSKNSKQWHVGS